MQPNLIYLDTNLWNALCDQGVSPAQIVEALAAKNACLALGDEAVYEMAKTFRHGGDSERARGMKLFSYVCQHLSAKIPIMKDNMTLVAAEMWALKRGSPVPEILLNSQDYETTRVEIERLSHGEVSGRVKEHIEKRIADAEAIRYGQINFLNDWPNVKQQLTAVPSEQFPQWLDQELRTQAAREHLAGQIKEYFPEAQVQETSEWAQDLLESPVGRASRAIVRRNLYYNWRCAHRGSISKDVYFDTNHAINAIYSDTYATKESKQTEYAGLLLTSSTRVAIYDGSIAVEPWLKALAESTVNN